MADATATAVENGAGDDELVILEATATAVENGAEDDELVILEKEKEREYLLVQKLCLVSLM